MRLVGVVCIFFYCYEGCCNWFVKCKFFGIKNNSNILVLWRVWVMIGNGEVGGVIFLFLLLVDFMCGC